MSEKKLRRITEQPNSKISHLEDDVFTIKERLKLCCRPTYRMRKLKNKAGILVLVWGFLLMSVYYYISYQSQLKLNSSKAAFYAIQASVCFVMPCAGWLADVYFGRYKVLYWSTWTMWLTTVIINALRMRKRVTVLILYVCVCVCVCVFTVC